MLAIPQLVVALALAIPGASAFAEVQKVSPEALPSGEVVWPIEGTFAFPPEEADKTRRAISGIACPLPSKSPRRCIVAFDEGREVRYVTIGGRKLSLETDKIVLLRRDKGELDAEGAAREGDTVYVTGSFSSKRKHCEANEHSRHVYRFDVDATTGRLISTLEDGGAALWTFLRDNPPFKKFAGECLGKPDHGLNIEGLAVTGGTLYFGFREPAEDEHTYVLSVGAKELFSGGPLSAKPVKIEVGEKSGIRDMIAVGGENAQQFLLLIGPDDDNEKVEWRVALWDGKAKKVDDKARLDLSHVPLKDCSEETKPEAMALLEDTASYWRVLVLSDGMCDGGPMSFRINK